jgi:hypothetical protein
MTNRDIKDLVEFLESRGCTERQVVEAVIAAIKVPAGSVHKMQRKTMSINDIIASAP